MTPTQQLLVDRMKAGSKLMWWGSDGPEIQGVPFWPQEVTVRALIARGILRWGEPLNETQRQCGIRPVVLADEAR